MIDYTSYNHAVFLKTSQILLNQAKTSEEGLFYYCLSSITFSAFSIEAFINHCGIHKEGSDWKNWDQTRPFPKFKDKLKRLKISEDNFANDLKKIFEIRHYVAHGRPDTKIHKNMPNGSNFEDLLITDFENKITLDNAEFIFEFTKKFIKYANEKSECNFKDIELFHIFGEDGGAY